MTAPAPGSAVGPCLRRRQHAQPVERTDDGPHGPCRNFCIKGRGLQAGMTQQDLDHADIDTILKQVRGKAMPQGMRPHTSGDRSSPRGIDNHAMELPCADGPHGVLPGKKPATRMHHALLASGLPPLPQQGQKVCRKHGVAISSPFAPFDPEQHALAVDIADLESCDLGHPQACPIGDRQGGLMLDADRRIEVPLLALWGARGTVGALYDVVETWREKAVDVRGYAIDCGHSPQEEAPAELLHRLDAFL